MGYYRGYRSWRSRGWGDSRGPSKYSVLASLFGEAVSEIKSSFLSLKSDALDELFEDYADMHGDGPAKYARDTFPKWKNGQTKLSGKTMERLIELVPPYLSPDQRFELLKIVLKKHKVSGLSKRIDVDTDEPSSGFHLIDEALSELVVRDPLASIPERVMNAAKWLYDDDITAARSMLAEADRLENDIVRANARKELEMLKRTIKNKQIKTASYSVEMPSGRLHVSVHTPWTFKKFIKSIL